MEQSRQRKAANIARQKVLQEQRAVALGHPVKSDPTPFILSLQPNQSNPASRPVVATSDSALNYFIKPNELQEALQYSKELTSPLENDDHNLADPELEREAMERFLKKHRNAEEAMSRIVNLSNGNTEDRLRVNIQRCIDTFGRHNTDKILSPKPAAVPIPGSEGHQLEKTPRAGPDTGSSEVQIAVLTTKILNLSRHLEGTRKDRMNKRNLRILVHKRQKLLRYLRRKERGGPRWQNLIESLGLSDASWKGEISL
jgi:ribosomal protein S15